MEYGLRGGCIISRLRLQKARSLQRCLCFRLTSWDCTQTLSVRRVRAWWRWIAPVKHPPRLHFTFSQCTSGYRRRCYFTHCAMAVSKEDHPRVCACISYIIKTNIKTVSGISYICIPEVYCNWFTRSSTLPPSIQSNRLVTVKLTSFGLSCLLI